MTNFIISSSAFVIFLLLASITLTCSHDDRKVYIVYMGSLPSETEYVPTSHHHSILQEILEENSLATDVIAHSYKRSFNGFAAKLTEQEAQKLYEMKGIVSVFPSERHRLHTTRSWNFVGFSEIAKRVHTVESDIIVGMIDSGIWPESFSDEGFGPPPKKWKGVCAGGQNFTCNKSWGPGAGNAGSPQTVLSTAPWMFTVGATITDRHLVTKIVLGNGKTLVGNGVNAFNLNGTKFPLVYGDNVSNGKCSNASVRRCGQLCLDRKLVKGKILICDGVYGVAEALNSGAIGTVLIDNKFFDVDDSAVYPMSATQLSGKAGEYVKSYFNSTRNPVATILKTESIRDHRAPMVASFSSRGPNKIMPDIIKLIYWVPSHRWSVQRFFKCLHGLRNYTFHSGTSMSCPHAAGAAAYVKSFHPYWPASFIKSALMTTAFDMIHTGIWTMLCNVGLDAKKIRLITNRSCPSKIRPGNARNLNYPSLGAHIVSHKTFKLTLRRTVTNVGNPHSTYHATIRADSDKISVTVNPNVLSFKSLTQRKSFVVTVVGDAFDYSETATGSLVWSDGNHTVRSPLVVYTHDFEHHHNEQVVKHHLTLMYCSASV
ncbi:hypothetical protein MKX03_019475 [Papaver bracteatum]|nr:hypothetical protein MKX03_019475 [Papaver bracteatum]